MSTAIIHAFVSLFAVVNPVGNVPLFLALTADQSADARQKTARKALLTAFGILVVFLLLGRLILALFGISLAAFRVAGGMIIFSIAFQLLQAKTSHVHGLHDDEHAEGVEKNDVAVTPLATPLLAGPGTITAVMALSGPDTVLSLIAVSVGILGVLALTYLIFRAAPWLADHLTQTALNIITRMMGLILAVIAVQMAASGVVGLFPRLG